MNDELRKELQDIIAGKCQERQQDSCSTVRNLLCSSFGSSATVKSEFESKSRLKEKQAAFLKAYALANNLWWDELPSDWTYLTRGGESLIYLMPDSRHVAKVNDATYYATWMEFFNSVTLHNLLFPNTAYTLIGFTETAGQVTVLIKQPFVFGDQPELEDIEAFLQFNGFIRTKRQDYKHISFGLILEDMHDENVIAKDGVLFFIDTVFYIVNP